MGIRYKCFKLNYIIAANFLRGF